MKNYDLKKKFETFRISYTCSRYLGFQDILECVLEGGETHARVTCESQRTTLVLPSGAGTLVFETGSLTDLRFTKWVGLAHEP